MFALSVTFVGGVPFCAFAAGNSCLVKECTPKAAAMSRLLVTESSLTTLKAAPHQGAKLFLKCVVGVVEPRAQSSPAHPSYQLERLSLARWGSADQRAAELVSARHRCATPTRSDALRQDARMSRRRVRAIVVLASIAVD